MIIGITGGIGCGKSTVMTVLRDRFRAKTIMADELGHKALQPEAETYGRVCRLFGEEIILPDGELERKRIASVIYRDEAKRKQLNAIVHPYVRKKIQEQLHRWKQEPLIAIETALMFETGCDKFCDAVWYVKTGRERRIQRLMQSRGYSREKAEAIMSAQLSEEEWERRCDDCIENEGAVEDLEIRLQELLVIR